MNPNAFTYAILAFLNVIFNVLNENLEFLLKATYSIDNPKTTGILLRRNRDIDITTTANVYRIDGLEDI